MRKNILLIIYPIIIILMLVFYFTSSKKDNTSSSVPLQAYAAQTSAPRSVSAAAIHTASPENPSAARMEPTATPRITNTYVINSNTGKFHKPSCSSVKQMKEKNKKYFTCTRDEMIIWGYSPCQRCNP